MYAYDYNTNYYESDYWSLIPTAHLLRLAMHAVMRRTDEEGLPAERLHGELGVVWMVARARFEQRVPIAAESALTLRVSGRSIYRGTYVRGIDFSVAGEPVARCELASVAVSLPARRILRPETVESFWSHPLPPENTLEAPRLSVREPLPKIKDYTVSYRDCDYNRHFNSSSYIDLVSELAGFYEGGPKIMESLHIEYSAEARPGQVLSLCGRLGEGSGIIKAEHESGAVCFCSEYKMRDASI